MLHESRAHRVRLPGAHPQVVGRKGREGLVSLFGGPGHVSQAPDGFHNRPPACRPHLIWSSTEPRRLVVDGARPDIISPNRARG